mgnify:CR=1 FL=1
MIAKNSIIRIACCELRIPSGKDIHITMLLIFMMKMVILHCRLVKTRINIINLLDISVILKMEKQRSILWDLMIIFIKLKLIKKEIGSVNQTNYHRMMKFRIRLKMCFK